jgi:guanylate kinase
MNNIFVISGPSGSGKSTLIKKLISECGDLNFSVSHTTRKKRAGELDGREYYFIDRLKFRKMIEANEFAEWAEVHGELYGTSIKEIAGKSQGTDMIALDIDVQGAEIIRRVFPRSLHVFIMPPDIETLRKRLVGREKHLGPDFERRLVTAVHEMEESQYYDHVIVNDDIEKSYGQLKNIYNNFRFNVLSGKKQEK